MRTGLERPSQGHCRRNPRHVSRLPPRWTTGGGLVKKAGSTGYPRHAELLDAAKALLPLVGEILGSRFVPVPIASVTERVRLDIAPTLEAEWRRLLAAVEAMSGPQECGTDPFPDTPEGLRALSEYLGGPV